jgi:hypothetical protein
MFGRGRREAERSRGLRLFAAGAGLAIAGATVLAMAPAHANVATTGAQLSLTGVTTASSPLGGSVVGVHPGDSVKFTASATPTAGLKSLGLDSVVGALTGYQVSVDFSGLPGGATSTTLTGNNSKTFTFPTAGTYTFTWQAKSLTGNLIKLDGNQLAPLGVKLNASYVYTGQVVVAADPPNGGISIQLPGVTLSPSMPVLGTLPPVKLPGTTLPTIALPSLPNLPGTTTGSNPGQGSTSTPGSSYTPPGLSIPEQVVPAGNGDGPGTVNDGGFGNALPNLGSGFGNVGSTNTSTSANGHVITLDQGNSKQQSKAVELASSPSPSAQMPVLLAIIAIIALSLVTATYARLYLLRRPTD